jgi:hypothetical protein
MPQSHVRLPLAAGHSPSIRPWNTATVPHPFPRFLRKRVGKCALFMGRIKSSAVLLPSQLPRRNLARRAVLIRIADLGPKRARLVLLAFRGIEIGKIELGHAG